MVALHARTGFGCNGARARQPGDVRGRLGIVQPPSAVRSAAWAGEDSSSLTGVHEHLQRSFDMGTALKQAPDFEYVAVAFRTQPRTTRSSSQLRDKPKGCAPSSKLDSILGKATEGGYRTLEVVSGDRRLLFEEPQPPAPSTQGAADAAVHPGHQAASHGGGGTAAEAAASAGAGRRGARRASRPRPSTAPQAPDPAAAPEAAKLPASPGASAGASAGPGPDLSSGAGSSVTAGAGVAHVLPTPREASRPISAPSISLTAAFGLSTPQLQALVLMQPHLLRLPPRTLAERAAALAAALELAPGDPQLAEAALAAPDALLQRRAYGDTAAALAKALAATPLPPGGARGMLRLHPQLLRQPPASFARAVAVLRQHLALPPAAAASLAAAEPHLLVVSPGVVGAVVSHAPELLWRPPGHLRAAASRLASVLQHSSSWREKELPRLLGHARNLAVALSFRNERYERLEHLAATSRSGHIGFK
ncbi:hypothetical protein TSOC_007356, partial [Tetrabaena socialis]